MKHKHILIIAIILFIICIIIFVLYKFEMLDNKNRIVFTTYEIKDDKKDIKLSDTKDNITYKDYIVTEDLREINYEFYDEKGSISGLIYIDDEDLLHITEEKSNEDMIMSHVRFKTMRSRGNKDGINNVYIFLISNNNKLYEMILRNSDIGNYEINEVITNYPVLNFTTLSYDNDINPSYNTLFVLEKNDNIYEIFSQYRYIPNVKLVFDSLMIFEDNTMASPYGNMIKDKIGNYYKIKYVFYTKSSDELIGKDTIVIITENNELITFYDFEKIGLSSIKVKSIEFDKKFPFEYGTLILKLDNDKEIVLEASCSTYYCINEFEE